MSAKIPENFLAPDVIPTGLEGFEHSLKSFLSKHDVHSADDAKSKLHHLEHNHDKQKELDKLKKVLQDKTHAKQAFLATDINMGFSSDMCLHFDTPLCSSIHDMCALVETVKPDADIKWCKDAETFCRDVEKNHPDLKSAIGNKLCTQFTTSVPACKAAAHICSSNPDLKKGTYCARLMEMCAK